MADNVSSYNVKARYDDFIQNSAAERSLTQDYLLKLIQCTPDQLNSEHVDTAIAVYEYLLDFGAVRCPKWLYDLWCDVRINGDDSQTDISRAEEDHFSCEYRTPNAFYDDNWILLMGKTHKGALSLASQFGGGARTFVLDAPLNIMLGINVSIGEADRALLGTVCELKYAEGECHASGNGKEMLVYSNLLGLSS